MNRLMNAVRLRDVIFFSGALALLMTGLAGLLGIAPAG